MLAVVDGDEGEAGDEARHGDEVLHGGVANAGLVVRQGAHVLRPANTHTATIHRFLRRLAATGFTGASVPVGIEPDGRERLVFIPGDVPLVPYPAWAQTDDALASVTHLLRRYHDAARAVPVEPGDSWSVEMADPKGGPIVCHNDVCLENVVFRDDEAVALLDFDFAAPGRPLFDLAAFARMCVPVDERSRVRFGWEVEHLPARLRLVADTYGLDADGRRRLLAFLSASIAAGGVFLQRRVAAGDPNFTEMWNSMGGMARFDRRRAWWAAERGVFEEAMR
jgi:hypothetical protein